MAIRRGLGRTPNRGAGGGVGRRWGSAAGSSRLVEAWQGSSGRRSHLKSATQDGCGRQRQPQFPLRPYSPVYAYHVGKEVGLARDLTATFQKGGVFWIVCCAAALVLSFLLRETGRAAHPQPTPA